MFPTGFTKIIRSSAVQNKLKYFLRSCSKHGVLLTKIDSTSSRYKLDIKVNNVSLNNYICALIKEFQQLQSDPTKLSSRYKELKPVVEVIETRDQIVNNLNSLAEFLEEKDEQIRSLAEEESRQLENELKQLDSKMLEVLLPLDENDFIGAIVLEVQAGVGGQEAMLFAKEVFDMYKNFAVYKGWNVQIAEYSTTDVGGIRFASALIEGPNVLRYFKYEAGVHRVQRVPATEKAGRIHTSTISVIALPQPTDIQIKIDPKDLKIETKRSTGAGGQHVNTTDSAVRIQHIPTGVTVESQIDRSQIKNRQFAMARLKATLYQMKLDSQMAEIENTKKNQVKSSNRNEKIRTYNFNQDRITDHRLQGANVHNLKNFMIGGEDLEKLIDALDYQHRIDALLKIVDRCK